MLLLHTTAKAVKHQSHHGCQLAIALQPSRQMCLPKAEFPCFSGWTLLDNAFLIIFIYTVYIIYIYTILYIYILCVGCKHVDINSTSQVSGASWKLAAMGPHCYFTSWIPLKPTCVHSFQYCCQSFFRWLQMCVYIYISKMIASIVSYIEVFLQYHPCGVSSTLTKTIGS